LFIIGTAIPGSLHQTDQSLSFFFNIKVFHQSLRFLLSFFLLMFKVFHLLCRPRTFVSRPRTSQVVLVENVVIFQGFEVVLAPRRHVQPSIFMPPDQTRGTRAVGAQIAPLSLRLALLTLIVARSHLKKTKNINNLSFGEVGIGQSATSLYYRVIRDRSWEMGGGGGVYRNSG